VTTLLLSPVLGPLGAVIDIFQALVMVLFILSGLLLVLVVLMQEGKGGGIAGAFGGAGAEAFGVKAGTVNRFTFWVGGIFLGTALLHAGLVSTEEQKLDLNPKISAPASSSDAPPVPSLPPSPPPGEPAPAAPGTGTEQPGGAPPPGPAPAPAPSPAPAPPADPAPAPAPDPAPAPAPETPETPK
jgi:protein translocase SecG subunit